MILLLLKVSVVLALTLALTTTLRRASAALRHLICVCGLAGALILLVTLIAPSTSAAFRINALSVPATVRIARGAPALAASVLRSLPWLWLAGTVLLLARIALGYWRVAQYVRDAGRAESMYADVSVPVVVGLKRAVILLPYSAAAWPAERIDAALRHERAHLRRGDLWTLLLSHMACAAYWFHPLVWMAAARMRLEQEQACDDAVVLSGFEPASYAEALLAAAQNLTTTRLTGCPMITPKTFRNRVARLLANGVPRVSSSTALRRAAIVFAGAVIAIGLLNGKQSADQDGAYRMGPGVSSPRLVYKVEPSYSDEARAAKLDGPVRISLIVGTDGLAHDINVVRSLGMGLDEKAVEAVQKWRFQPGTKDGQPVRVRAIIEVNFKLL